MSLCGHNQITTTRGDGLYIGHLDYVLVELGALFGAKGFRTLRGNSEIMDSVRKRTDDFMKREGRRPRILVAGASQGYHDRGMMVFATAYADMGFDVDISPVGHTPDKVAKMAVENDVHIVGVSSSTAEYKTLVFQLMEDLKKQGGKEMLVVVIGKIPPADYDLLYEAGVIGTFGTGVSIKGDANHVLNVLEKGK